MFFMALIFFSFRSRERTVKERPIKGATKGFTNEYGQHRQVWVLAMVGVNRLTIASN